MISRLLGPGFTLLLSAFLLIASVLLSRAAGNDELFGDFYSCLLYTSPSPRDVEESRMPSSA